ncbi:unnamed protein product [Diabrotica balteata]|uniref:Uncharacterized protein n=1 Tax=Diabrotica balteata TaxID=107213 RepID=A0A9P0GXD0_DIABA|nr:unnamed protein product [Diabrotica balteata]
MVPKLILFVVISMGVASTEAFIFPVMYQNIQQGILQLKGLIEALNKNLFDVNNNVLAVVNWVKWVNDQLSPHLVNIETKTQNVDNRLANIETFLKQMDQRDVTQLQNTHQTVVGIQNSLLIIMEKMKNEIIATISAHQPPSQISPPIVSKEEFDSLKKQIMDKISIVTNSIGKIENAIDKIKDGNQQTKNLENLKKYFNKNQELFTKFDKKLDNCNSKISNEKNEEWKLNVTTASNGQQSDLKNILAGVKLLQNKIDQVSQNYDRGMDKNFSLPKQDKSNFELINYIKKTHIDTIMKLNDLSELTNHLGSSFVTSNYKILNKIEDLNRLDQVMQNVADGVTDTKTKVEFGVNKILAEISKYSKEGAIHVQEAVCHRLGTFKTSVLDPQIVAVVKATSNIKEDIQQVLQKIGIMDQKMRNNSDALNHLKNCTTKNNNNRNVGTDRKTDEQDPIIF